MQEKWATPEWKSDDEQKKVASFFPGKIASVAPVKGPHIFSEHGPAESESGPVVGYLLVTGYVIQPNFAPQNRLTMVMRIQ